MYLFVLLIQILTRHATLHTDDDDDDDQASFLRPAATRRTQFRMSSDDQRSLPATWRAVVNATTTPATRVIADLTPQILSRHVLQAGGSLSQASSSRTRLLQHKPSQRGLFATIGRAPARVLLPSAAQQAESKSTASALDLAVVESVDQLLALPIDPPATSSSSSSANQRLLTEGSPASSQQQHVPFFTGYQATAPSASQARKNRRRRRAYLGESHLGIAHGSELGLKQRMEQARGLLDEASSTSSIIGSDETLEGEGDFEFVRHSHASASSTPVKGKSSRVRRTMAASRYSTRPDAGASDRLSRAELIQDIQEIEQDQRHLTTRRQVLTEEATALDERINKLQAAREDLRRGLLGLREEELELEDELEGVREQLGHLDLASSTAAATAAASAAAADSPRAAVPQTSRRRRGPAFLPKEHDSLPVGVAFMTLQGHNAPITALDFSEPYGLLVSSTDGADDSSMRVWDLSTGEQIDTLQTTKPEAAAKCLQVESTFCVSGSADGHLKVWDLEKLDDVAPTAADRGSPRLGAVDEVEDEEKGPCVLDLEAHTKAVTSLYFDGPCLVSASMPPASSHHTVLILHPQATGSSDKTLKQWDIEKGVPIVTVRSLAALHSQLLLLDNADLLSFQMDIVWAMNDHNSSQTLSASPTLADLAAHSGPGSGADPLNLGSRSKRPALRAGRRSLQRLSSQHYRLSDPALHDFSQPWTPSSQDPASSDFNVATPSYADGSWDLYSDFVGSLQFWGYALASGSADGCVRMWDMRTGQAHRTLIGHVAPVTSLQFDEYHLVSGSLDKSIRVWDLRTGSISDTLRFDGPVTALQFDTRKIVAAAGDNGVKVSVVYW